MYRLLRARAEVRERRRQARHPATVKPELVATAPGPGVDLGHHQAARPAQVDLVPPLRHLGRVLPLRRGLGGRRTGDRRPRRSPHRRMPARRRHRPRPAHHPRRPRHLDDLQTRRPPPRRPGRHQAATPGPTSPTTTRSPSPSSRRSSTSRPSPSASPASPTPARFSDGFFDHYNHRHHHSGLALLTPADVHHGRADTVIAARQTVLDDFYARHPERFRRPPMAPQLPTAVWINKPAGGDHHEPDRLNNEMWSLYL